MRCWLAAAAVPATLAMVVDDFEALAVPERQSLDLSICAKDLVVNAVVE